MKIYTKKGDGGQTSTLRQKVPKASGIIALLGIVDEANAVLGWAAVVADKDSYAKINRIQHNLFDVGASLAGCDSSDVSDMKDLPRLGKETEILEKEMDHASKNLPLLKNFILPGGSEFAARLHFARCIIRSTEHHLWLHIPKKSNIHMYFNRLSDWCFVMARRTLHEAGLADVIWRGLNE